MSTSQSRKQTLFLTQFAILLAIEAIFCFTPLGSLPALGPVVATLFMVPVAITSILLGPLAGTTMGAFAGLFSFMVWTFLTPPMSAPIAFVFTPVYSPGNFWSLVICFVPRILAGTVPGLVYRLIDKFSDREALAYCAAGAAGSLVNTFGVTGGIYFFFGGEYAEAIGAAFELLLSIIGATIVFSGIPEAVVCALAALFVCRPIQRFVARRSD